MKHALAIAALCATLAIAGPVKRAIITDWEYETVTVTVTGSAANAEATPAGEFYGNGWGHGDHTASEVQTTTAAPTPSATPPPAATPAPAPAPVATAGLSDYAAPIVLQHNIHRYNHSSPDIAWDDDLASIAQSIAQTCVYEHNTDMGGGGYGQNIGAGAPGTDVPKMITNAMYNGEVTWYPGYGGEPNMDDFENWGHFSQIVWASTTSVGCYTAYCPGGLANVGSGVSPYFTVCNYKPAGNFGGQYGKNVLAPTGSGSVVL